jgi:hypothetical protein
VAQQNISKTSNSTSCKTNRITKRVLFIKINLIEKHLLTSLYNTIYIPQEFSTLKIDKRKRNQ